MKKVIFYFTIILVFNAVSCKEKIEKPSNEKAALNYSIDLKKTVLSWTAYKTTEKIPVKGVFQEVKLKNEKASTSPIGVLDDLEFEIPVASIYSKDSIRDWKLKEYFFGVMKTTLKLTGTFHSEDDSNGIIALTMNGLTKDLPYTYKINGDEIELTATMNLDNWQAQYAIESLNVVCNDKHKAGDGISKTWNEVAINAKIKVITKE